jgi:hypothetical protein
MGSEFIQSDDRYQWQMSYSEQLADFAIIVPLQMVQRGSEIPCNSQQS